MLGVLLLVAGVNYFADMLWCASPGERAMQLRALDAELANFNLMMLKTVGCPCR